MKLSDEDYHNLKKDQVISDAIMMINNIMYRYRSSLEIFKKFGSELSREEFHEKLKVPTTKEERIEQLKQKKIEELTEADGYVRLTESLIKNQTYCNLIGIDRDKLEEYWLPSFQFHLKFLQENKQRVGPNKMRDAWIGQILMALEKQGYKPHQRIDFIYRLYMEYDWELQNTGITGDVEIEGADEELLKDRIKQIDRKVFSVNS